MTFLPCLLPADMDLIVRTTPAQVSYQASTNQYQFAFSLNGYSYGVYAVPNPSNNGWNYTLDSDGYLVLFNIT